MQWYAPVTHICIEPYGPYADVLEDAGYMVCRETAKRALRYCQGDAVYLLDVIEHMERHVGQCVIEMAVRAARCQVVIYTPMGFLEQTHDAWGMGGERWQTHRSGWTPSDFPGWDIETTDEGFFASWTRTE